jgi:prefoldin subunit 5
MLPYSEIVVDADYLVSVKAVVTAAHGVVDIAASCKVDATSDYTVEKLAQYWNRIGSAILVLDKALTELEQS